MKTVSAVFLLYLLFGIGGCASIRVASDYDEMDFLQYKTFGWMEKSDQDADVPQSLLDKRIVAAIEAELVAKGYQKRTTGVPDFLVDFITSVDEQIILHRRGDGTGMGRGRGQRGAMQTYTEGTLVVDIVDPKLNQTVWRGWAISAVDERDESEETVHAFVEALLEQFPPQ